MDKITGKCASCGSKYLYTAAYRELRGNFCQECCSKIEKIHRLRTLLNRRKQTLKDMEEMDRIREYLMKKWMIQLEEYDKERNIQDELSLLTS